MEENSLKYNINTSSDASIFHQMPAAIHVYENTFFINYEDKEVIKIADNKILMTNIKNLKINQLQKQKTQTLKTLEILEPSIVLFLENGGPGHFHFIYDVLLEVEAIKSILSDVKIKIINLGNELEFVGAVRYLKEKGFFRAYDLTDEDVIDLSDIGQLNISSLFFINTKYNPVASKIVNYNFTMRRLEDMNTWGKFSVNALRSRFIDHNDKNKIFITRLLENDKYRKIIEAMRKTINQEPLSEEEDTILFGRQISDYKELLGRVMDREEEILLEKMFSDAGYRIVNPNEYGDMHAQADMFNSAKYVVGLSGAAFINCCFCSKDAEVLVLNPSDKYTFAHDKIIESFGIKAYLCPKRMPWKDKPNTAKEIFDAVKRNHPQFLDMV
jgi:hypothetical protein